MNKDLIKKTAKELNLTTKQVREVILPLEQHILKSIRQLPKGQYLVISIPYFGRLITDTRSMEQ
jgi:hypothetical protein